MARARARSSAAHLRTVTSLPADRPEPPPHLHPEEAHQWREITGALPPSWFASEVLPLLEQLVCHIRISRWAQRHLRALPEAASAEGMKTLRQLSAIAIRESRAIASLSTKLRLTPSSRYNSRVAATLANGPMAEQPWKIGAEDGT